MATEEQTGSNPAVPAAAGPQTLWVQHRGGLHQVPVCPHTRPYTTVALMRSMTGWQPGDPAETRVVSMVDGTRMAVTGSGLSTQDPMFCAEMETEPLPECRCEDLADADANL